MTVTDPSSAKVDPQGRPMIEDRDPRTNRVIGYVPSMTSDDVALAVHQARDAFGSWSGLSFRQRAEHLLRVRDLMLDRLHELVKVITSETGKLGTEAILTEVMGACEVIGYYAKRGERALRPHKLSTGSLLHKKAEVHYEPLGVVAVISPWNYPFVLSMTPIVTALFAGNTVVHKPSEITPLVGRFIGKQAEGRTLRPPPDLHRPRHHRCGAERGHRHGGAATRQRQIGQQGQHRRTGGEVRRQQRDVIDRLGHRLTIPPPRPGHRPARTPSRAPAPAVARARWSAPPAATRLPVPLWSSRSATGPLRGWPRRV